MASAVLDLVISSNGANDIAGKTTDKLKHFASKAHENPLKQKSIEQHCKEQ
jgi:hypothetical protein